MSDLQFALAALRDLGGQKSEIERKIEVARDEVAVALRTAVEESPETEPEMARKMVPKLYWGNPLVYVRDIALAFPNTFASASQVASLAGPGDVTVTCRHCCDGFQFTKSSRSADTPKLCEACIPVVAEERERAQRRRLADRVVFIHQVVREGRLTERVEPEWSSFTDIETGSWISEQELAWAMEQLPESRA